MLANSSAAIGVRAMRSSAFIAMAAPAGAAARLGRGRRGLGAVARRERVDLLAQALDLLQDLLELVLGAAELPRQARDVAPARRAAGCSTRGPCASKPIRVSATTFSVAIASSSPNDSRETTRSAAFATRDSASS